MPAEWIAGRPRHGEAVEDWADAVEAAADDFAARAAKLQGRGPRERIRDDLAGRLEVAGYGDRAAKQFLCHAEGHLWLMGDGRVRERPGYRCRQARTCPWCARSEASRRAARLGAALAADRGRHQFVTLTARNFPIGGLAAGEAAFWRAWDKLRHRVGWRRAVDAASASMETTWNAKTGTFHVHLHVAVSIRRGGDFSWAEVQRAWAEISGSPGVNFRPMNRSGAVEATKYTAKLKARGDAGGGLLDMPDVAFKEWAAVFLRPHHRLWRTYGAWRSVSGRGEVDPMAADRETPETAGEPIAVLGWDRSVDRGSLVFLIQPNISADALRAIERALTLAEERAAEKRKKRAAKGGERHARDGRGEPAASAAR